MEEVVARDAEPNGCAAIGVEGPVDQADEGGIHLGLARERCLGPAVQLRLDPFHRQVGALHEAHLRRGAAGGHPSTGVPGDDLQHLVGVGQVGLDREPELHAAQVRVRQEAREGVDRQLQVAVLLDVDGDARAVPRGGQAQHPKSVLDPGGPAGDVPRGELAGHRGHLDRDVVDVRAGRECLDPPETDPRLGLAEHGLAEQVEDQGETVRLRGGEVLTEAGTGVGHQMADQLTHPGTGRGHRQCGREGCQPTAESQQDPVGRTEHPPRCAPQVTKRRELPRSDSGVLRAHHPVHEPDGQLEPLRIGHQCGEPRRRSGILGAGGGPAPGQGGGRVRHCAADGHLPMVAVRPQPCTWSAVGVVDGQVVAHILRWPPCSKVRAVRHPLTPVP